MMLKKDIATQPLANDDSDSELLVSMARRLGTVKKVQKEKLLRRYIGKGFSMKYVTRLLVESQFQVPKTGDSDFYCFKDHL